MVNDKWNKLFHYKNENKIVSKEFYLTGNINATPKQELKEYIKLLHTKKGKEVACNFPARYNNLKTYNYDIPQYNLKECKGLSEFYNSFKKDKVSIVFTSEYTNNPSSAFGHTMLLFSNNNENLEIADTVHYAAKTSKSDGFLKYSYNGFTGKYNGHFTREAFFKKIYDYNVLEQRYMHIYTLNFSKEQIKELIYHLYEIRKATFKYYFLDENCASETTDLLNVVTNKNREELVYYLPIDTVKDFKRNIIKEERFIPLLNKLDLLFKKMTKNERANFNKITETNSDVPDDTSDIVKEALVYYTTFKFRRFHQVFKNYDNVMNQSYKKSNIVDTSPSPINKTSPSNFGYGYYNEDGDNYFNIHYRPLFLDRFDIQENVLQQSEVSTFTIDLMLSAKKSKLDRFDLINIKSNPIQFDFYKPSSWGIYSGLNRENKSNKLRYKNELGVGKTFNLSEGLTANVLQYVGAKESDPFLKPYLNLNYNYAENKKLGFNSIYEISPKEEYYKHEVFYSSKADDNLVTFKYSRDNSEKENKFLLSFKYNF